MISGIVKSEDFEEWIYQMHHRFQQMVQTMKDIHYLIQANTNQRVPLDTGRLEESFRYDIVRQDDFFIEMHSIYSARSPIDGYDYAEYQHTGINWRTGALLNHPKRGEQFYLLKGVQASESMMWTMLEQDYLSLFQGGIK